VADKKGWQSLNKTYVNGVELTSTPVPLSEGGKIRVGELIMEVSYEYD